MRFHGTFQTIRDIPVLASAGDMAHVVEYWNPQQAMFEGTAEALVMLDADGRWFPIAPRTPPRVPCPTCGRV